MIRFHSALRVLAVLLALLPYSLVAGVNTWTSLGPEGGVVEAIAFAPSNGAIVYAGVGASAGQPGGGGVHKSTDGGNSWNPVNNGILIPNVNAISVAPTNPDVVYVSTARAIYKTSDGGANWLPADTGINFTGDAQRLAIDPTNSQTVFAIVGSSLLRTTDSGSSWTTLPTIIDNQGSVVIDPTNNQRIFSTGSASCTTTGPLQASTDGGSTWIARSSFPSGLVRIAIDPRTPTTLYVVKRSPCSGAGIYKSTDSGLTFTLLLAASTTYGGLAVDPTLPNNVWIGATGNATSRSTDGGLTWSSVSGMPATNIIFDLAVQPGTSVALAGVASPLEGTTSLGVFRSTGAAWTLSRSGLKSTALAAVAFDPTNPTIVFAGGGDDASGVFKSTDSGTSWTPQNAGLATPNGQFPSITQVVVNGSTVLAIADSVFGSAGGGLATSKVYKSINGGLSWALSSTGVPDGRIYEIAPDPGDSSVLFAATSRGIYKTNTGAGSWFQVNTRAVFGIAVHRVDPSQVAAVAGNVLLRSTDAGTTWTTITTLRSSLFKVRFDPVDPQTLYLASTASGVFKSIDGGLTTTTLSNGLTFLDVRDLEIASSNRSFLVATALNAGTGSFGVFRSTDAGDSWLQLSRGLLNVFAPDVALHPTAPGTILAATEGMGVASIELVPPVVSSISPATGPTAGGTIVTITGSGFEAGARVTLGGIAAISVTRVNSTTLQATTRVRAAGLVDVVVSNPDLQSGTLTNGFRYGGPPATITSVAPNAGGISGGTNVTITGSGFDSTTRVTFGGTAAVNVTIVSATTLTVRTPARAAGAVDVVVFNPDSVPASRTNGFTYFAPAPGFTGIAPNSGGTAGGREVTISGSGFGTGAIVTFGGAAASRVVVLDSATLVATTPARAAGPVDVTVTNSDNQSVTSAGAFTYVDPGAAPTIVSVAPATGSTSGGTSFAITGTNFASDATATIGGELAREVRVTGTSSISAITPPHAAGAVTVVVTNGDGQSVTRANAFTYGCNAVATPALTTPLNSAVDTPTSPLLTFSTTAGASRYDVLLDTVDPPVKLVAQNLAADTSAATISFTPSNLPPGTRYFWRVVAKGDPACLPVSTASSPVQSFTTVQLCRAPGAFTLTAPAASATGVTAPVQLTWTVASGASSYDVFLGNGTSFSRIGTTSAITFAAADLAPGTTYTWHVVARAACDASLTTGTERRSFTVAGTCAAAGVFSLTAPTANETNVSPAPELKWSASANASSYDIFLDTVNPPRLFRAGLNRTSLMLAGLHPGRTYFWRVVANVSCDTTRSSTTAVGTFTIRGGCVAPGKPSITFLPPTNVAVGQPYVIAWSEVADLDKDGSYIVERSLDSAFATILDSQLTGSNFASFTSGSEGTVHHRVRAIPSCGTAGASANSDAKPVAIVRGRPNVVFTVNPRAVVTNVGETIGDKKTRFTIENITSAPVQLILGKLEINSNPFFTIVDPTDPDAFLITLQPRRPKSFEVRFSGPTNTQAGSYQGLVFVSAPGSDVLPYAFVNLKVGGQGSAKPEFRLGTTPTEFLSLPAFSGDDANRAPVEVDVFNPGSTPMELAAEVGPEAWLVPESGWNASPVPANSSVKVRLRTRRERAPAGSALPRYTYFTVRTKSGESARLLVQDRETSSTGNGRGSSLDPGVRSYIVPRVVSMTTGTGRPVSTRLRLSNVSGDAVQAELFFTPAGVGGFDAALVRRASILLPPNDVVSFTDPLVQLFGLTPPASGSLEVRADAGKIGSIEISSSFASNATGRGQRDGKMPAVIRGEGARAGATQVVGGLRAGTGITASLALVETTGLDRASVLVALYDKEGVKRGEQVVELLAYEVEEIANLLTTLGGGATTLDAGRLVLTVESGAGAVVGVVTLTDSATDGTATLIGQPVPAVAAAKRASTNLHGMSMSPLSWVTPSALTEQRIVPLAVHGALSGSATHTYRTSLSLTAPLDGVAGFTLRYVDGENALAIDRTVNLAAGKAVEYLDVVEELFGVGATVQSQGQILVTTDRGQVYATLSSAPVGTTTWTLIGTVPVVTPQSEALTGGGSTMQRPLLIDGVEQSVDATRGSRWSMLLNEISGQAATVTVRLYEAGNRSAAIAEKSFTVAALSQTKLETLFAAMDLDTDLRLKDRTNVMAVVTATGGTGMVAATAVAVDNVTGDAEAILLAPRGGVPATGVARVSAVRTVEVAAPLFRRGDADGNSAVSVADVFYLISNLFTNGPAPVGNGDANSDGTVSVADVFFLINFLFAGGPAPAP